MTRNYFIIDYFIHLEIIPLDGDQQSSSEDDDEWQPKVKRRRHKSYEEIGFSAYEKNLSLKENHENTHDIHENHEKNSKQKRITGQSVIVNRKESKKKNSYAKKNEQLSDFIIEDEESEENEHHSNADSNIEIDCNSWTSNNWERDIAEIESIERDPKHGLIVFITW